MNEVDIDEAVQYSKKEIIQTRAVQPHAAQPQRRFMNEKIV